ncbi:amidohydrolase [Roseomonas terrae]|uniref:Amidohydrolase n=1 Tax=Neoroseomonas terrae TaxID=424799 RepID=A0ABS5EKR0_9PROT|nr:hypothetical protein [Neoroseomonas terrae]MBR0651618.1 amidohydrolase [Neoroseomonas terrae]
MARAEPRTFIFLGNGDGSDAPANGLHALDCDFNDAALPHGIGFWVRLVRQELGG